MTEYAAGFVTLPALFLFGSLIAAYFDRLKRKRRMKRHDTCGMWHMYRLWAPWFLLRLTTVPVAEWRCSRGAQVPVDALFHGIDRSNVIE